MEKTIEVTERWPSWASAIASVLAQLFLVIQGIFIARSLGPAARGDLGWIQWAPPLISCVAAFGMTQALPALVGSRPERGRPLFWSGLLTAFALAIILSVSAAAVFWWTDWPAQHLVGISIVFLLWSPIEMIVGFPRDYLLVRRKFRSYDFLKLLQSVLGCSAIIALSTFQTLTPSTVALTLLSAAGLLGLIVWIQLGENLLPVSFASRGEVLSLLRFGGLCLVAGLASVLQARLLQWKVGVVFGADGLGFFLVAATWGALGGPIWQVIQVRFYPAIAQAASVSERRVLFQRAIWIGSALCVVAIVVGYIATPLVFPLLMGGKFSGGLGLAVGFAVAAPFQAFGAFMGSCVRALGLAGLALAIDYVGAATTIIVAFVVFSSGGSEQAIAWAVGVGGLSAVLCGSWLGLRRAASHQETKSDRFQSTL